MVTIRVAGSSRKKANRCNAMCLKMDGDDIDFMLHLIQCSTGLVLLCGGGDELKLRISVLILRLIIGGHFCGLPLQSLYNFCCRIKPGSCVAFGLGFRQLWGVFHVCFFLPSQTCSLPAS